MVVGTLTKPDKGRSLITTTLFLAGYATNPPGIAAGLLLIDIAKTFQTPVGIMSQMSTSSSTVAIFTALVMAALSVKYRHTTLMQAGLALIGLSAVGCYLAQDYWTMLIVFALTGMGTSMVQPMTRTLVGEYFPRERQAQAIGWLIAGSSISYLVSSPLMAQITNLSDWRTVFLIYILPVTLLSILLTQIFLPRADDSSEIKPSYNVLNSFRTVLTDASAMSCLLGGASLYTAYQAVLVYGASFYREFFKVDRSMASNIVILGALSLTVGSVGASRIIDLFGKKKVIVVSSLFGSLFIALYANTTDFWFSLGARILGGFFSGVAFSGLNALLLGQVPRFRGTVMSLNSAISSIGAAAGTMIGGFILLSWGYSQVAIVLALFGVFSAVIVYLRTMEN
jgi:predicted MFS family arabinose efflux permease